MQHLRKHQEFWGAFARNFLARQPMTIAQYIERVARETTEPDELFLFAMANSIGFHVTVLENETLWTTKKVLSTVDESRILLINCGLEQYRLCRRIRDPTDDGGQKKKRHSRASNPSEPTRKSQRISSQSGASTSVASTGSKSVASTRSKSVASTGSKSVASRKTSSPGDVIGTLEIAGEGFSISESTFKNIPSLPKSPPKKLPKSCGLQAATETVHDPLQDAGRRLRRHGLGFDVEVGSLERKMKSIMEQIRVSHEKQQPLGKEGWVEFNIPKLLVSDVGRVTRSSKKKDDRTELEKALDQIHGTRGGVKRRGRHSAASAPPTEPPKEPKRARKSFQTKDPGDKHGGSAASKSTASSPPKSVASSPPKSVASKKTPKKVRFAGLDEDDKDDPDWQPPAPEPSPEKAKKPKKAKKVKKKKGKQSPPPQEIEEGEVRDTERKKPARRRRAVIGPTQSKSRVRRTRGGFQVTAYGRAIRRFAQRNRVYKCHRCQKKFTRSGYLTAHLARYHPIMRCKKRSCRKKFTTRGGLLKHRKQHKREECPHACTFPGCDARFPYLSQLVTHQTTHTEERPFQCAVKGCGAKYKVKGELNRHQEVHQGLQFMCPICGKVSRTKKVASDHYNSKHIGVFCDECGEKFDHRQKLKNHRKWCPGGPKK